MSLLLPRARSLYFFPLTRLGVTVPGPCPLPKNGCELFWYASTAHSGGGRLLPYLAVSTGSKPVCLWWVPATRPFPARVFSLWGIRAGSSHSQDLDRRLSCSTLTSASRGPGHTGAPVPQWGQNGGTRRRNKTRFRI